MALTCAHVMGSKELVHVPKTVLVCEKSQDTNKYMLQSAAMKFGGGYSSAEFDVAAIVPLPHVALVVNLVEEIDVSVHLTKWWAVSDALVTKENYLKSTDVMKCGISSRKTTGKVIGEVTSDSFYVAGNETTPFAVPGDSGSLVLNQDGVVLGIVTGISHLQLHGNVYVTDVLPIWNFYDWLVELH